DPAQQPRRVGLARGGHAAPPLLGARQVPAVPRRGPDHRPVPPGGRPALGPGAEATPRLEKPAGGRASPVPRRTDQLPHRPHHPPPPRPAGLPLPVCGAQPRGEEGSEGGYSPDTMIDVLKTVESEVRLGAALAPDRPLFVVQA